MTIQFKNKHLFFALAGIWQRLDYRFKYQINQLMIANNDDEFVQAVEVDDTTLVVIYKDVSAKPEGISSVINQEMKESLQPQLLALANLQAVEEGTEEPNEAMRALIGINEIAQINLTNLNATIFNGKTQLLA